MVVGCFVEDEILKELLKRIDSLTDKVEDWSRLPAEPLVSVYMITYNHEQFIAQALDGVLMQQVDFPYEIVIGEDKSTDRTREIVCDYQRRHPDKIRLHLSKENLYSQKLAGYGPLNACRGKYIALCEGDDYWTDPLKLQKQVDAIEKTAGSVACFHTTKLLQLPANDVVGYLPRHMALERLSFDDLVLRWGVCIQTAAYVFRRDCISDLPFLTISKLSFGDAAIFLWVARKGSTIFLSECMSVYRMGVGVWSTLPIWTRARNGLKSIRLMDQWFLGMGGIKHRSFLRRERVRLSHYVYREAFAAMSRNDYYAAARLLIQSFVLKPMLAVRFLKNDHIPYMIAKMLVARKPG